MSYSKIVFFVFCISAPSITVAQKVRHFTEGLVVYVGHHYGRDAIYTDELAYRLFTGTLEHPGTGGYFGRRPDGDSLVWEPVKADSLNRLRGRRGYGFAGRGGGYVYLTYQSDKQHNAVLNIRGNSAVIVNGELHAGDPYFSGYLNLPVKLKKGMNEFYVRGGNIIAQLIFQERSVFIQNDDLTMPSVLAGQKADSLWGAVVIVNTSNSILHGLSLRSEVEGKKMISAIPPIPALSVRKVPFIFNASGINAKGKYDCNLTLAGKKILDTAIISVEAVNESEQHSITFISKIDGSLQYYAVTPQKNGHEKNAALFLSVHGAGVEAIGQARAYQSKDWGTLVAATNRRPRGFNWEDWGRIDALEVLDIAKAKFQPDPKRIYLTGHSMGGHGTWFLGATYPDKWAAIGPCAGYPTLKGYGSADGLIPESGNDPMKQILLRSGNQSDVIQLAKNYKPLGVYILHGDSDKVVSVKYARQMRGILGGFHNDMSYYEYPGGEHWFGDQSVDWKPLFDFFRWHERPVDSAVDNIEFITASPGISSSFRWASIEQQEHPLQYSQLKLRRDLKKPAITGSTKNIRLLKLVLDQFENGTEINIVLDGAAAVGYNKKKLNDTIWLQREGSTWKLSGKPGPEKKGPHRYGTFKDAFNHHMVFVYGTSGNKEENEWNYEKARYDAETWYYRGNGAVDVIADSEYSLSGYRDRGVILFGNRSTNSAWKTLLADCPIQVERNKITAGNNNWTGEDLGVYFVWPIASSPNASVAVISGTGKKGMKAASANQYFAGASGFPDFMIFNINMLKDGEKGVKLAGFFDNDWKLDPEEYISNTSVTHSKTTLHELIFSFVPSAK